MTPHTHHPPRAGVYKPGGASLVAPRTLLECIARAHARAKEVQAQLEAAVAQREQEREDDPM